MLSERSVFVRQVLLCREAPMLPSTRLPENIPSDSRPLEDICQPTGWAFGFSMMNQLCRREPVQYPSIVSEASFEIISAPPGELLFPGFVTRYASATLTARMAIITTARMASFACGTSFLIGCMRLMVL